MKKILFMILFLCVATCSMCFADTIEIPSGYQVLSATYSSGGGKTMIVYVKVLCERPDGSRVLFLKSKTSVSGMFGMGRFTLPEKIDFVENSSLRDEITWK